MIQLTEPRLIFGLLLLGAFGLSGCEGESRSFEEAVEVQQLGLQRVDVSAPVNESSDIVINRNQSLQLTATGNTVMEPDPQIDTSVALELKDRNWTSSDSSIVSVSEKGLITGGNNGIADIAVSIGGLSASFRVRVEDATLISIDDIIALDGNSVIERCLPEDYFAVGSFTGNTTRPVYDAQYSVSADSGATVETVGLRGRVNAMSGSAVTLIASVDGGLSTSIPITVDNTLATDGIEIKPNVVSINENAFTDLTASGTYTPSSLPGPNGVVGTANRILDITDNVNWEIVVGVGNAEVSNSGTNTGRLTGKQDGVATVRASCGPDVFDEVSVTITEVSAANSSNLTFSIGIAETIDVDEEQNFTVKRGASFADGINVAISSLEFTTTKTPTGQDVIDFDQLELGILEGLRVGTTTVTVTIPDGNDADDEPEATGTFTVTVEDGNS